MEKLEKTKIKNETNKISFKLNNSSNELKLFIKKLLQTAIISFIGAIVSCSVFFLFLSMFIFNLDFQKYHFKADSEGYKHMIIDSQVQIIQALQFDELIDTYFNY